jgi:hypothetical protein
MNTKESNSEYYAPLVFKCAAVERRHSVLSREMMGLMKCRRIKENEKKSLAVRN